ncbi:MAG TPA: cbb3-type cytochrome oxidase assembly protein CcoS [Campylobacterales bacterium]|nr:cbb3-type cytochrome oxidase assembly protein CcoS [Campylobacterales bacterium]HIP59055.1 cbb3-type cytochrome oxidase assembly protein CcoS [Campylobacterales bacterium]
MSSGIVALMIGVSTFLGVIGLFGLLWGLKTGQFDDEKKFLDGVRHDGVDELRDAAALENKKKEAVKRHKEKNYGPPD